MGEDEAAVRAVLVVDDTADTRRVTKKFLELGGYRVLEAEGGKEAVEVARRERPRLILLDLSAPYVDVLTTARRLRAETELSETPVVIISALEVSEVRQVTGEGYGYIPKPIDFAHLKTLIGITLGEGPVKTAGL